VKNQKIEAITPRTLIVGVDVAKAVQWARFVDYRGLEQGKALKFPNNKTGFENILASIKADANTRNTIIKLIKYIFLFFSILCTPPCFYYF
jgi:hypothetical protein